MKSSALLFALMLAAVGGATAQTLPAQQPAAPHSQAPGAQGPAAPGSRPEIAACAGKASGTACSFTGRQGEQISGSCFTPPAGGPGGTPPACCRPSFGRT